MNTIGFDTSNYTTSIACFDGEGGLNCSQLLPVKQGQLGLRQSDALFAHVKSLPELSGRLFSNVEADSIAAVAVSTRPRAVEGSYMPCFLAGIAQAKLLSDALHVPLYEVSHQQGHVAAGLIGHRKPKEAFVALHLSGGTTELLACENGKLTLLGGCADLHAGQLVDRVGVAMGLPFPAGPHLEKLAMRFEGAVEGLLPVSMEKDGLTCHLSGVETRAQQWIKEGKYSSEKIAAEVFDVLARTVARLLAGACQRVNAQKALVVGGVASSVLLRKQLMRRLAKQRKQIEVLFGQPAYSADNAAGVAAIGMQTYLEQHSEGEDR